MFCLPEWIPHLLNYYATVHIFGWHRSSDFMHSWCLHLDSRKKKISWLSTDRSWPLWKPVCDLLGGHAPPFEKHCSRWEFANSVFLLHSYNTGMDVYVANKMHALGGKPPLQVCLGQLFSGFGPDVLEHLASSTANSWVHSLNLNLRLSNIFLEGCMDCGPVEDKTLFTALPNLWVGFCGVFHEQWHFPESREVAYTTSCTKASASCQRARLHDRGDTCTHNRALKEPLGCHPFILRTFFTSFVLKGPAKV